jgi:hypothetical protein
MVDSVNEKKKTEGERNGAAEKSLTLDNRIAIEK